MQINRQKRNMQDISMIPLINIIFLMLIFFMVSGSIGKFEIIQIDLPVASSSKPLDEGQVVIVVGYRGQFLMNDELIEEQNIGPMLANKLKVTPNAIITVKVDAKLPAARLIDMMDVVRRAGGKNLSIVTQSV